MTNGKLRLGIILTVTGTGFVAGTTVQWNGAAVPN